MNQINEQIAQNEKVINERNHKINYFKKLIELKQNLMDSKKAIANEILTGKHTSQPKSYKWNEANQLLLDVHLLENQLFYHRRELAIAEERATAYQAMLDQLNPIVDEYWGKLMDHARSMGSDLNMKTNKETKEAIQAILAAIKEKEASEPLSREAKNAYFKMLCTVSNYTADGKVELHRQKVG